jgi:DNA-binding beta-propeller fold protein YncE
MKRISMMTRVMLGGLVVFAAAFGAAFANAQSHYKLIKTIELPGKGGHGDWVAFDEPTNTVWIGQAPAHNVVVIDASSLAVKATIPDVQEANGIDLDDKYGYVTDAKTNTLVVVDKRTYNKVATLDSGGKSPDGVAVDRRTGNILVANDDSNTEVTFEGKAPFRRLGTLDLKPQPARHGPDVGLYVQEFDRLYQPVDNMIDVIDPNTNQIEAVWDFGIKSDAKPMAYDSRTKRLVIGTRDQKMLIVDPANGKLVTTVPFTGGDIDQTTIDVAARRAFMGDKSGNLEVMDLDSNSVIDHISTEKSVHTLAVDPKTHRLFVYLNVSNKVAVFEPS